MGISQRRISAIFDVKGTRSKTRKPFPDKVKTIGDWLVVKRVEAGLTQTEIAKRLHIGKRRLRAWEQDKCSPTEAEWTRLAAILPLDTGIQKPAALTVEAPRRDLNSRRPRFESISAHAV